MEIAIGAITALLGALVFDWEYYTILFVLGPMILFGLIFIWYLRHAKESHENDVNNK